MATPKDPLHTQLCEDLGIEFPVVAFTHCSDVLVAVTKAGGMAVRGVSSLPPEEIEKEVKWIRDRIGDRPFGLDIVVPANVPPVADIEELRSQIPQANKDFVERVKSQHSIPDPKPPEPVTGRAHVAATIVGRSQEWYRKQLDVILDLRVPVFCSAIGNPAFVLEACHERGMKVFGLVGSVRQAKREAEAGVDYIIAQGYDAAGHCPDVGTFSLVPQVVDAIKPRPVLAAGGVTSGKALAAALCMGAVGVWTGTLWLACHESDEDIIIKEKVLKATERDTVRTYAATGKPCRLLKSKLSEVWEQPDAPKLMQMPHQSILWYDLEKAAHDHKVVDFMTQAAGQGVGLVRELKPCSEILYDLVGEAQGVFEQLCFSN